MNGIDKTENHNNNQDVKHKDIEVISGNVNDLDISPVYEHLNVVKPKTRETKDKNKKIIIPEVKEKK